jgi:transposase
MCRPSCRSHPGVHRRAGRKTDATDARAIALAAVRGRGLHRVGSDAQLEVLRVLAGRRRALGKDHTRMISQLHQLLLDLIPGGARKDLSAAQAKVLLAGVRPRDTAGKVRQFRVQRRDRVGA